MVKKETVLSVVQELRDLFKEFVKRIPVTTTPEKPFENKRLVRNSDGNFTDKQRPLIWAKEDLPTKMTPEAAIEACKKLGEGWRPASDKDFESIIDRSRNNPAIIPEAEVLGLKTDGWYVTSTPYAGDSGFAWCVGLGGGGVDYCIKDGKGYVRPVRVSQ